MIIQKGKSNPFVQLLTYYSKDVEPRSCSAEVVFGDARKKCEGEGICFIAPSREFVKMKDNCLLTRATFTYDGNSLSLNLVDAHVCPLAKVRFLSTPYFNLAQSFQLPDFLVQKLSLKHEKIAKGLHLIFRVDDQYKIVFKLE